MAENIKMWFTNALDFIDPTKHPEVYDMLQCGESEFIEYDKQMKEDIIGYTDKIVYLEGEILEMMEAIEERNDEIEDLKNELLQYEDVVLP